MLTWLKIHIGPIVFWLAWPVSWWFMHGTQRSRVVILFGDTILLQRGTLSTGEWGLPGGGLHKGEDAAIGACREVYEELGIILSADELRPLCVEPTENNGIRYQAHYFLVTLSSEPKMLPSLEVAENIWMPLQDIMTSNTDASTRRAAQLIHQ